MRWVMLRQVWGTEAECWTVHLGRVKNLVRLYLMASLDKSSRQIAAPAAGCCELEVQAGDVRNFEVTILESGETRYGI